MKINHEIILPNEDLPFKLFLFEGKNGNYHREKHWHRSVEIFAVYEGELLFDVGEHTYPLTTGKFMIINSNEVHSIQSPKPNRTIVLQIPLQLFENYYTGDKYIWFTHDFSVQDEVLMELMHNLYERYDKKERGYELQVKGIFYLIMHLLIIEYQKADITENQFRRNRYLNHFSVITSYIKENYATDLTLENVACKFGYSPTYLSRMFQKYAGINFKLYLSDIRLQCAYLDLKNSNDTLSEIALNHGFPNSKAFARAFIKKYGMQPSKYRAEIMAAAKVVGNGQYKEKARN
ncbi:AraC family transcriptional regulator [Anaerosporobacter sp.]|uniref:AraC family transcriptional regulator n=1 Tax=Anaerosporobacter sp. TaxID=1872529 RepID=UPI00286F0D36|nr:AraC family transcriptional regulator [Anaerosporobacter sp.]